MDTEDFPAWVRLYVAALIAKVQGRDAVDVPSADGVTEFPPAVVMTGIERELARRR